MATNQQINFNDGFESTSNFLTSLQFIPTAISGQVEIPNLLPASVQTAYNQTSTSGNNSVATLYTGTTPPNLTTLPLSALISELGSTLTATPTSTQAMIAQRALQAALGSQVTVGGITQSPFTDLAGFMTTLSSGIQSATSSAATPTQLAAAYNGLLTDFTAAMGIQINSSDQITGGDWGALIPSVISANAFVISGNDYSTASNPNNPFIQVFNSFLASYKYPPLASNASPTVNFSASSTTDYDTQFINQFHQFLSGIATLTPTGSPSPFMTLANYQEYYNAITPNATQAGFQSFLANFYQQQVSAKGFFLPSQSFGAFVQAVNTANPPNFGSSSIAKTDSAKAIVLNRIILLLIEVINALQNVGIAQANNLTYLTNYQNAYTALLQQIPTFLADGKAPIGTPETGSGGTQATSDRNDINSSLNGIFADNLRALQTVQSNNAKTVQSNINTTNDDVNQQTDMATTLLQQMSQLLGSIFR